MHWSCSAGVAGVEWEFRGFLGFWNWRAPAGCVHRHKSLFNFTLRTANEKLRRQSSCITKSTGCLAENMPFQLTQRLWSPESKATVVSGPGGMVWHGMQTVHNRGIVKDNVDRFLTSGLTLTLTLTLTGTLTLTLTLTLTPTLTLTLTGTLRPNLNPNLNPNPYHNPNPSPNPIDTILTRQFSSPGKIRPHRGG